MKSALKVGLALLVAAITAMLVFALISQNSRPTAFPPLPTPNGYNDFITAGKILVWQNTEVSAMDITTLSSFINTNSESWRLLQLGLARNCSVHTAEFLTNNPSLIGDGMAIKRLANLGLAMGRLAELEGRTNDAIAAYLTGIRLGNKASQGGFVIHRLIGISCEIPARYQLTKLATNLSPAEMKAVCVALEAADAETVPWEEIQTNEQMYLRQAIQQFANPISLIRSGWSSRSTLKGTKFKHLNEVAQRRLLTLELGLHCYRAKHQSLPNQLSDLSPEFFARVPLNPFTERSFEYQPVGTNWILLVPKP